MPKLRTRYLNRKLLSLGNQVDIVLTGKWLFLSTIVGVISGFLGIGFVEGLEWLSHFSLGTMAGYHPPIPSGESGGVEIPSLSTILSVERPWVFLFLPACGAGLAGLLIHFFAKEAMGGGTDSIMKSYHSEKGIIRPIVPFIKFISSILTIGTGGSAGREGPIAQICGGVSSFIATKFNLSEKERKIMLVAGMGAGIGAIFQSPIGGAIYSTEVLYKKDIESEGLMPSIIASIIAYSIFSSISGWKTIFKFEAIQYSNPSELLFFIALAIIITLAGMVYTSVFKSVGHFFQESLKIHYLWKPVIGGVLLGMIAFKFPPILESSYGYLQMALDGNLPVLLMLSLAAAKILSTSLTVKSGASGGIFAPSFVIGGLLGGAFGLMMAQLFPSVVSDPRAFVLVGMAAFLSSVENVPIAATILITEISGSYELIVPLIFSSAISYIGGQSWSIYSRQLNTKLDSPSYRGEFHSEIMDHAKVRTAYRPVPDIPVIHLHDDVKSIMKAFTKSELLMLPVFNQKEELVGLISLAELRTILNETDSQLIIAADIVGELCTLHLNDPLTRAFDYFKATQYPELPVLAHGSEHKIIGILSERNFLIAYERSLSYMT